MGTIVAVRVGREVTIAADSINLAEDVVHPNLNVCTSCLMRVGESILGINCSYSYQQVVENALSTFTSKTPPPLNSKFEIRKFFDGLHEFLKTHYQVRPVEQNGAFEGSPMNAIVVNRFGIFKVDSTRAVYEFTRFWSIGTGEAYALGALAAAYEATESSEGLAKIALGAVAEFQGNRGRTIQAVTLHIPELIVGPVSPLPANSKSPTQIRGARSKKKGKRGGLKSVRSSQEDVIN